MNVSPVCQCTSVPEMRHEDLSGMANHVMEFVIPPLTMIAVLIAGNILFSLWKQPSWWSSHCTRRSSRGHLYHDKTSPGHSTDGDSGLEMGQNNVRTEMFFSGADLEVLHDMKCFQQNPTALLKIALPGLASLALCPVSLYMLDPMVRFFYPPEVIETPPKINDVVSAFLVPAGLVYAIGFGFALQDAIEKCKDVSNSINEHVSAVKQIAFLVVECPSYSKTQKMDVLLSLKKSLLFWMDSKVMGKNLVRPFYCDIWNVFRNVQNASESKKENGSHHTGLLLKRILLIDKHLDAMDLHSSISVFQWVFLELHGFIAFFGILLIDADSYRLQLTMCILTVFSVSLFCYLMSDFDSPLHGAFCADLNIVMNLPLQLEYMFEAVKSRTDLREHRRH